MCEGPEWRGREGRLEVRRRGEGGAGIERGGGLGASISCGFQILRTALVLLCWRCPPLHSRTLISFSFIIIMFLESLILPYIFPVCCAMKYFHFSDCTLSVSFSHHIPLPRYPFIRFPTLSSSSSCYSSLLLSHRYPSIIICTFPSSSVCYPSVPFAADLPSSPRLPARPPGPPQSAGRRPCLLELWLPFWGPARKRRVSTFVLLICFPFRNC